MRVTNHLDLVGTSLIRAVMHPVTSDPSTPADGQVWYRADTDRLMVQANGAAVALAFLSEVGGIAATLLNAQTIVAAVVDDTPIAMAVAEQTLVGRITGGDVTALSAAQIRTLLNVENGATADQSAAEILAALITVDGAGSGLDADLLDGQSSAFYAAASALTGLASESFVNTAINNLIDISPGTLDTLNELAAALGDDPNFASTVTTAINLKPDKYSALIGNGALTSIVVTHNLGTKDFTYSVRAVADDAFVWADCVATTLNTATFLFAVAPATDSLSVTLIG